MHEDGRKKGGLQQLVISWANNLKDLSLEMWSQLFTEQTFISKPSDLLCLRYRKVVGDDPFVPWHGSSPSRVVSRWQIFMKQLSQDCKCPVSWKHRCWDGPVGCRLHKALLLLVVAEIASCSYNIRLRVAAVTALQGRYIFQPNGSDLRGLTNVLTV